MPVTVFPSTYIFQTRQGAGTLQVLGTSDNPKGLRVRIKPLIVPAAATQVSAGTQPAPPGPVAAGNDWWEKVTQVANRAKEADLILQELDDQTSELSREKKSSPNL